MELVFLVETPELRRLLDLRIYSVTMSKFTSDLA